MRLVTLTASLLSVISVASAVACYNAKKSTLGDKRVGLNALPAICDKMEKDGRSWALREKIVECIPYQLQEESDAGQVGEWRVWIFHVERTQKWGCAVLSHWHCMRWLGDDIRRCGKSYGDTGPGPGGICHMAGFTFHVDAAKYRMNQSEIPVYLASGGDPCENLEPDYRAPWGGKGGNHGSGVI